MVKHYAFNLTVWLRLANPQRNKSRQVLRALKTYLEERWTIDKVERVDDQSVAPECSFVFQLTWTFVDAEVDNGEITDEAVESLTDELRDSIGREFEVTFIEICDDALTSFLLDEWEE